MGVTVADFVEFPDHHWYAPEDLDALTRQAQRARAEGLITTEKDAVRLRDLTLPRRPLWVVSVRMTIESGQAEWRGALKRALGASLAQK